MKWYKKQLDKLKESKPETAKLDKGAAPHKGSAHHPLAKSNSASKGSYFNPVAARNVNRPKTDSK